MKRLAVVLASLAVLTACSESPTETKSAVPTNASLATVSQVFTSGADVTTWDAIVPASANPNWPSAICTNNPAVGLNANWQNPHNAFVLTGHPWANDYFTAPWINAYNSLSSIGPSGQSWTKYRTTVSGNGSFVIRLLADNCSWIYLDGTLVGVQNTNLAANSYGLTLNGTHTLEYIIFDGGGANGGKFKLETTTNPPPPLNSDLDSDGHPNADDDFPLDPLRWETENLVVNGSFERPIIAASDRWQIFNTANQGLTGWTVDANTVDTQNGETGFYFIGVPDGKQVLDMNNGAVSQSVATTANYKYRVTFSLSQNYVCTNGASVRVTFGGTTRDFSFTPGSGENAQNMRWDVKTFEGVSTGNASSLTFTGTGFGGCGGAMIDAVKVEAIGPADATAPVIVPTVAGTLGLGGWYTSDVNVSWSVTDAESDVSSTNGCDASDVTSDTHGVTFTCTATSSGGTATQSVTVKRDATPPVLGGPSIVGTFGNNGWYVSDVSINWPASDATSGVASTSGCSATLSEDTFSQTFTCTATNGAGLTSTSVTTVKRDATPPVVLYSGNAGSYTVDQNVAISCSASDAMSGLASNSCANINGAAYAFAIGANNFSASAEDRAGNTGSASVRFTVSVTSGSLCSLVERWVSNAGVANSMCVKLRQGSYGAFRNELSAQSGKKISESNAAILLRLVNLLG